MAQTEGTNRSQSAPTVSPLEPSSDRESVACIALGSNLGDRERHLLQALRLIDLHPAVRVARASRIYETDPVGYTEQPPFLNMAASVATTLEPLELLRFQLDVEKKLGRVRNERWGPRTIDLDLLLYDNVSMDEEELTLPHPRMLERAFVLVPLHDVLPEAHVMHSRVAAASAAALRDGKEGIAIWKETISWPEG